jgi:hypothetical protein
VHGLPECADAMDDLESENNELKNQVISHRV